MGLGGTYVAPAAAPYPTVIGRQINMLVTMNGADVADLVGFRISYSVANPVPRCTIVVKGDREQPAHERLPYNGLLEISIGTTLASWSAPAPSTGCPLRFRGFLRNRTYNPYPALRSTDAIGYLGLAAEYFNGEDSDLSGVTLEPSVNLIGALGGLTVRALTGSITAPANAIITAVLLRAGIPAEAIGVIGATGRLYGMFFRNAIWTAGTSSSLTRALPWGVFQEAGESALDYCNRYGQIEAVYIGASSGGFYRLVEFAGKISCILIGGHPGPALSTSNGTEIMFTEGVNILSDASSIERQYPIANRSLVQGFDPGQGAWWWEAKSENPFMAPESRHYDPSPPNSSLIEWPTPEMAAAAGFGMDCQTVANARLCELNREGVEGQISSLEDYLLVPTQTVRVQGPGGQAARLGTGENLFVLGVDIELRIGGRGEPVFRQRIPVKGGGIAFDPAMQEAPAA